MKKLIAIVLAVTLVAVGSGVALGQDDESFPYCTDTPQYTQVKVAQVPIPWQFWAIETDPTGVTTVIDRIRISPTWLEPPDGQPAGEGPVFIRRQAARLLGAGNMIPLEELVWDFENNTPAPDLDWAVVDDDPVEVPVGEDVVLEIPVTPEVGAVLVAYEVYKESAPGSGVLAAEPDGHFINEAILESESPRAIVQILVNFDIHNGTGRDDITNFELDFLGLEFGCEDVIWALGFVVPDPTELWGANEDNPLVVRPITGGTEVKWVQPDRPLSDCEWLHLGLMFNYSGGFVDNINATVQGYWTVLRWTVHRGTPGYWKNHPEAWPMESIAIGGVTYTKSDAIAILKTPGKGDKTYTMFNALVAAMLNVANGTDPCIQGTIDDADEWMEENGPVGDGVKAGGKNSPWRDGEPLYETLDAYNNGEPCP